MIRLISTRFEVPMAILPYQRRTGRGLHVGAVAKPQAVAASG